MSKSRRVVFNLTEVASDPVQYKPYNPRLTSDKVTVAFDVPESLFTDEHLTPSGVAYICDELATAINTMHVNRADKINKLYK